MTYTRTIIIALLLLASTAQAREFGEPPNLDINFKFGIGMNDFSESSPTKIQFVSLGLQDSIGSIFEQRGEAGFWLDKTGLPDRKDSIFVSYSLGMTVNPHNGIYASFFVGVLFMNGTDGRLSTPVQFTEDIEFGISDSKHRTIGCGWKHISNAGIWRPNLGRDFAYCRVGFSL